MKLLKKSIVFLALIGFSQFAYANVMQYFFGTNYRNPSELRNINHCEVWLGAPIVNIYTKFNGSALGGIGTGSSSETDILPFFFGGIRINKKLTVGLNVSQPFFTNFQYGDNSILNADVAQNITRDVDINPQFSYQLTDKLAIGAGFIANDFYNMELNFSLPQIGHTISKAQSWSYGWDLGFSYTFDPKDFLNIAYFSKLTPNFKGSSTGAGIINHHFAFVNLNFPATTKAEFMRILTDKWALNFKVYYTQWSIIKTVIMHNVVGGKNLFFPLYFHNSWAFDLGTRYQIKPKWALLGSIMLDEGAADLRGRTVAFPTDNALILALGTNYSFSKKTSIQLVYAHGFVNTKIDHPLGLLPTVGSIGLRGNSIELSFIYKA
jgi:long-chain fatty acid transport protein